MLWVRIDRARKLPITLILRALGYGTDEEIVELLGEDERLHGHHPARRQRQEPRRGPHRDLQAAEARRAAQPARAPSNLFNSLFFDPKRYDLMRVGRYKFNKKLSLATRIQGQVADAGHRRPRHRRGARPSAGETISREKARDIQNAGVNTVDVRLRRRPRARVVGNHFVDAAQYLPFDPKEAGVQEMRALPRAHGDPGRLRG